MSEISYIGKPLVCYDLSQDCNGTVATYAFRPTDLSTGYHYFGPIDLCSYHFEASLEAAIGWVQDLIDDSLTLIDKNDSLMSDAAELQDIKDAMWRKHNDLGHMGGVELCELCNHLLY